MLRSRGGDEPADLSDGAIFERRNHRSSDDHTRRRGPRRTFRSLVERFDRNCGRSGSPSHRGIARLVPALRLVFSEHVAEGVEPDRAAFLDDRPAQHVVPAHVRSDGPLQSLFRVRESRRRTRGSWIARAVTVPCELLDVRAQQSGRCENERDRRYERDDDRRRIEAGRP